MTKPEMYVFIARKGELVLALVGDHDPVVGQVISVVKANLAARDWPEESYILADQTIDEVVRDQSSSVVKNVDSTLRREFGFARLSESPKRLLGKVLKRGKASAEREAVVIRDALAGDLGEWPEETLVRLSKIMREFEEGASQRRP